MFIRRVRKTDPHTGTPYFEHGEKIILCDLTNTSFEGNPRAPEARRGASKEKRTDRPLVTLAMILDEEGFPKTSEVYLGNVSEPSTLESILDDLLLQHSRQLRLVKPTSEKRCQKKNAIKNRFQTLFEQDLQNLADSLGKKGGVKKYERVLERIGRLKEKEHLVARFYGIRVEQKNGQALGLF